MVWPGFATVVCMGEAPTPGASGAPWGPDGYDGLTKAPDHIVDLMLGVMRPYSGPPGQGGYARAAREDARRYADRIWAEAAHAGAAWGLAAKPARMIEITGEGAERLAELIRRVEPQ